MIKYFKKRKNILKEIDNLNRGIKKRDYRLTRLSYLINQSHVKIDSIKESIASLEKSGKLTSRHKKIIREMKKEIE